mmetsp:Transcript_4240/g.5980  ORF Transcript_4240/g.5980 Transcript_4240/m.5980 type:complete len:375 (+) Transcript_4240:57-1181(+)
MSLSFLSKKPWHVTTVKNVEKVWLAEKKEEEEAKKLAELEKQIKEEREIDELRKLQQDAGLVTDPKQKLEWMYEGPGSAIASAAAAEEYKLGKKAYVPTTAKTELSRLEDKSAAGSTWFDAKSNNANEQFVRVNEDPLYKMRQSEKRVRETTVLKNPLAMKRIKQSLADELLEYDQQRRARKENRKAAKKKKKEKKKRKKKKHYHSDDDDDHSDNRRPISLSYPRQEQKSLSTSTYGLTKGVKSLERRDLGPPRELLEARLREEKARKFRQSKQQLDDDERQRLLTEMATDGQAHEQRRQERMRHHRKTVVQECLEEDALNTKQVHTSNHDDLGPTFLHSTRSAAFGTAATMDLSEAVQRGRNRHQRKVAQATD